MRPPPPGPMHPPPGGPTYPPGGPGPYPHPSPSYQNPQSAWPQPQPQSYYRQGPQWQPPTQNICPVMCQPGQKPGDPCGPVPNCRCALDLGYGSMTHHPCIFIPSG
ncbi:hypothetical protein V5799_013279 [Amblyomma americanum]|uniref:Uncharacterized protein n=1 Tax=Amblyomma americanum TaxID=6943 RepID=A0AAQ4E6H1_AMBAM